MQLKSTNSAPIYAAAHREVAGSVFVDECFAILDLAHSNSQPANVHLWLLDSFLQQLLKISN